jgi:sec-independent protein translocase protein TatC
MDSPGRFVPMTPEEMDAELEAIEAEEARLDRALAAEAEGDDGPASEDLDFSDHPDAVPDANATRLRLVQTLRDAGNLTGARALLYEVLEHGDADQRMVARNILGQLDT